MAYLRAGSFTQSNDDPCSPASHCFSSHRCNYCTEAWPGRKPPQPGGRSQFPAAPLTTGPTVEQEIPPRTTVLKCEANGLICNIENIGDALCRGWRDALIIVDAHARLAPTGEKWDDKRGNFLFLSRWCVIVWATVRGGGVHVWDFSLPIPSDKDFNSP